MLFRVAEFRNPRSNVAGVAHEDAVSDGRPRRRGADAVEAVREGAAAAGGEGDNRLAGQVIRAYFSPYGSL